MTEQHSPAGGRVSTAPHPILDTQVRGEYDFAWKSTVGWVTSSNFAPLRRISLSFTPQEVSGVYHKAAVSRREYLTSRQSPNDFPPVIYQRHL
jgi:hypothetical protein